MQQTGRVEALDFDALMLQRNNREIFVAAAAYRHLSNPLLKAADLAAENSNHNPNSTLPAWGQYTKRT
jgi:hypothetical protein